MIVSFQGEECKELVDLLGVSIVMCELDGKVAGMPEAGNRHLEVRVFVDPAPSVVGNGAAAVGGSVVFGDAVPRPRCQTAA